MSELLAAALGSLDNQPALDTAEFTARLRRALFECHAFTLQAALNLSRTDMSNLQGIGSTTLAEWWRWLKDNNLLDRADVSWRGHWRGH